MNRRSDNVRRTHEDGRLSARDSILRPGEEPPIASHLLTPRTLYSHHGIYAGNGHVIHYAGLAHGLRRGPVEVVSLDDFARGHGIRVRHDAARFDHREVLERARSRLGERRYRVLTNNCQHFCAWALRDEGGRGLMKATLFRLAALLMTATCALTSACAEDNSMAWQASAATVRLQVEGNAPSLERAATWLNSAPLSDADLRGKVVLIDFWTYTCINWIRTLPYVRAWAEKYEEHGLVVVGVHTPEFSFERDLDNVRRSAKAQRVDYPIAIDSDYALWRAFDNHYWPALYFIDAQGRIRHHQFGEGRYDEAERIIQQLLTENGPATFDRGLVRVEARGAELDADWSSLKTAETYVGYERSRNFANAGGASPGWPRSYDAPKRLRMNQWGLAGDWTIKKESALVNRAGGRILYRFHARDLHLVMGPGPHGKPVKFRVLIDGQPPAASRGLDVDDYGRGTVVEPRMYQLIRQPAPIKDRQFEIEFLDAGAEVFSFTFG